KKQISFKHIVETVVLPSKAVTKSIFRSFENTQPSLHMARCRSTGRPAIRHGRPNSTSPSSWRTGQNFQSCQARKWNQCIITQSIQCFLRIIDGTDIQHGHNFEIGMIVATRSKPGHFLLDSGEKKIIGTTARKHQLHRLLLEARNGISRQAVDSRQRDGKGGYDERDVN
ncbi:hypothetical protein HJC23_013726, partial [Cyclotella cryptica]